MIQREIWRCYSWRLQWCGHKPRNTGSYQKLEEARDKDALPLTHTPRTSRGQVGLLTPWFWLSDTNLRLVAWNSEKIKFYCLKPPSLWSFVTPAPGNRYACKGAAGGRFWFVQNHPKHWTFGVADFNFLPPSKSGPSEKAECTIVRSTKHRGKRKLGSYTHPGSSGATLGPPPPEARGWVYEANRSSFHLKISWLCLGLSCSVQHANSWLLWYLVPRPAVEPGPPALGTQSLRPWTTRKSRV